MSKADRAGDPSGFRKPLNSPALRMVSRATQASSQLCTSLPSPSPSTGSMPQVAHAQSPSCSRSRLPNRLSLSLQNRTFLQCRRRARYPRVCRSAHPASAEPWTRRRPPHWRPSRRNCTAARTVRSCAGSSARSKSHSLLTVEGAVSIEPQRGSFADCLLNHLHAREIGVDVLADLHLEGAEALRQPGLRFPSRWPGWLRRIDWRQQWQRGLACRT